MRLSGILIGLVALSLAACSTGVTTPSGSAGSNAPVTSQPADIMPTSITPLGRTYIDDKAVSIAWDSLEATRVVIDAAVDVCIQAPTSKLCWLKPGSPNALKIAGGLEGTKRWLLAARAAQKAGEAEGYRIAIDQASLAFQFVKDGIAAFKGSK